MIKPPLVGIISLLYTLLSSAEIPPPGFKVAFLGDQGLGPASEATLRLVKEEGADLLINLGDFDYTGNAAAWEDQTDRILGRDFPQISVVGNHDAPYWSGPEGYGRYVRERLERMGIAVRGEAGVQCAFKYRGLFFVLTAPGVMSAGHPEFIRRQLDLDSSIWRISAWHVVQASMQVGTKGDEAGWGVYEESRKGGAIIATAHEHSYSRTHLLNNMQAHTVASRGSTLRLERGRTFAFVSGLGGDEIRPQSLSGDWWASIYTASQGASSGAMFATFNVDGNPGKASFAFKNVSGTVIDSFEVYSELDRPVIQPGIQVAHARARTLVLDPKELGLPPDGRIRIVDMFGRTLWSLGFFTQPITVTFNRPGIFMLWGEGGSYRLKQKILLLP